VAEPPRGRILGFPHQNAGRRSIIGKKEEIEKK